MASTRKKSDDCYKSFNCLENSTNLNYILDLNRVNNNNSCFSKNYPINQVDTANNVIIESELLNINEADTCDGLTLEEKNKKLSNLQQPFNNKLCNFENFTNYSFNNNYENLSEIRNEGNNFPFYNHLEPSIVRTNDILINNNNCQINSDSQNHRFLQSNVNLNNNALVEFRIGLNTTQCAKDNYENELNNTNCNNNYTNTNVNTFQGMNSNIGVDLCGSSPYAGCN